MWQNLSIDFNNYRPEPMKTHIAKFVSLSHAEDFIKSNHILKFYSIHQEQFSFLSSVIFIIILNAYV